MYVNEEIIDVLEHAEMLGKKIKQSEDYHIYKQDQDELYADDTANKLINQFHQMKEDYDDVQRFGRYHPDYSKIMKEIRQVKRDLDMHDTVATFKQSETSFQSLLDDVSELVAHAISHNIKAPRDGLALKDSGDGCGCGSGGQCGCAS
ncbi:YlbF family regulator [Halalkalibacillus halophilus]|uniref:YlbF family regulator n=1 Tax=Halalkalibacillus halophilus TaxID=392827 RepID=UPI0003FE08F0|nr:YlbF family regulator [Halalkalibacillus halophilus]